MRLVRGPAVLMANDRNGVVSRKSAFCAAAAKTGPSGTGPDYDIMSVTSSAIWAEEKCNGILTF